MIYDLLIATVKVTAMLVAFFAFLIIPAILQAKWDRYRNPHEGPPEWGDYDSINDRPIW